MAKGDRWSDNLDVKVREMRNAETVLGVIREREFKAETTGELLEIERLTSGSEGGGWKRTQPVARHCRRIRAYELRHKPYLASRLPYLTSSSEGGVPFNEVRDCSERRYARTTA
jgi:hypothetical protein